MRFEKGQLVQVYNNKLVLTLGTERKLTPLWSPPRRIAERLLNSYRLETLEGTLLDGLFNTRHLRGFQLREGMELAMQQKEYEGNLASQASGVVELDKAGVVVPAEGEREGVADDDLGGGEKVAKEDLEESDWEDKELEAQVDNGDSGVGFFYNDEEEEEQGDEDMGIGARVAVRRRGHLHNGGGQME